MTPDGHVPTQPTELTTHLQNLFAWVAENLEGPEADRVAEVLCQYADVFARHDFDLGCFSAVKHPLTTGCAHLIQQPVQMVAILKNGCQFGLTIF